MRITKKILLHHYIICVLVVVNLYPVNHNVYVQLVESVQQSTPYGLGLDNTCAAVDPLDLKESEVKVSDTSVLMGMEEYCQEFVGMEEYCQEFIDMILDSPNSMLNESMTVIRCSGSFDSFDGFGSFDSFEVVMVIPEEKEEGSMWTFVKPFTPGMWYTTAAIMIYTALVVWLLDQKVNPVIYREMSITEIFILIWSAVSTMPLSQNLRVESRLGRIVIAIWLLVMSIIVSSYTDNFNSRLNAQKTNPTITITSLEEFISEVPVGYLEHHFIQKFLHRYLAIESENLTAYTSAEECAQALSEGPNKGGVAAVLMEASNALHFGGYTIYDILLPDSPPKAETPNSLGVKDFLGWFIITGLVSTMALIVFFFNLLHGLGTDPDATGQGTDALEMVPPNDDREERSSVGGDSVQTMDISNISDAQENAVVEPSSVYIPHVADESGSMEDQNI